MFYSAGAFGLPFEKNARHHNLPRESIVSHRDVYGVFWNRVGVSGFT